MSKTRKAPTVDRVEQIAALIAELELEEKRRLFQLLTDLGELSTEESRAPGFQATQLPLDVASPKPNQQPDYIVIFDGGSKGNPGWGYGSYVLKRVQDGAQRLKRLDLGDGYTNNEAEYDTLLAALQDLINRIEAADRQPCEFSLEVRGDSTLVINQLLGKWKAKEPRMQERRDQGLGVLRRFRSFELRAQPREDSVRVLGH